MQSVKGISVIIAWTAIFAKSVIAGPEPLSHENDKAVVPIAPAPAEACDWTGFYIGGNIGATWNDYHFDSYDVGVDQPQIIFSPVTFTIPSHEFRNDAEFTGGAQVGFNKQWGHFVLGVEGDFQGTHVSRSTAFVPDTISQGVIIFGSDTDLVSNRTIETNWLASGRGRLGFAHGCFLFYATGGVAFADVDVSARDKATSTFFILVFPVGSQTDINRSSDRDTQIGWTAGGGAEYMMSPWCSIGVEYRHSDFGDQTYHFASHGGTVFPGSMRFDLDSDQVVFKVDVKLGGLFGSRR